jgi:hypothetical protein
MVLAKLGARIEPYERSISTGGNRSIIMASHIGQYIHNTMESSIGYSSLE